MRQTNYRFQAAAICGLVAGLAGPAEVGAAVTGQWEFNGSLTASIGVDMEYFDGPGGDTEQAVQFGLASSFSLPPLPGGDAQVIRVPKNSATMGLLMRPGLPANGGGVLANQYSLVFDLLFPASSSGLNRSLVQIDDAVANSNAAELSVNAANAVGALQFHGTLQPDTWHRLVVTVDLAAPEPTMVTYIDGVQVGAQTLNEGVDGRWAMNPQGAPYGSDAAILFSSESGASEVVFVNSIQVHDTVLPANYVHSLGGPSSDGIPASVTVRALVSRVHPERDAALVLPDATISAEILEGAQPIVRDTIRLMVNGTEVSPQITSPEAGRLVVTYDPGLLAPLSEHEVELKFTDPSADEEVSAAWSFRVAPYHLPPIDLAAESLLFMPFELAEATHEAEVPDLSPRANHGVLTLAEPGNDLLTDGRLGSAIDFQEHTANYVVLSQAWSAVPNSFSAWVRIPVTVPAETRVGVICGSYPAGNNINWEVTTSGNPRIFWNNGNPNWVVTGIDLRTGEWEHIAFVRDPARNEIRFYLNGSLTATLPAAGQDVIPGGVSYIGADPRGSATPHFRGAIDEVSVIARTISDEEVWRIYTRGVEFPDYSFPVPQVVSTMPADQAVLAPRSGAIAAYIDEMNSLAKVDRESVEFWINGVSRPVTLQDVEGRLVVAHEPDAPLEAGTTYTNRLVFLADDAGGTPVEKVWTFTTVPAPAISTHPLSQTVIAGSTVILSVAATVNPPVAYQWRHNGNPIADATNAVLTLQVTEASAGDYDVVIRDEGGEIVSNAAVLTVLPALPSDPAESLRYGLTVHFPFDEDFSSSTFGFEGTPVNGAGISTDARLGEGALSLEQASQQYVRVDQQVIADGTTTYSVAGWFKVTGGAGRRFLWETFPNYAISTEITPAGTLKAFSQLADNSGPNADTFITPFEHEWHHAAVTFDSAAGVASIYFDGVKVDVPYVLPQGVGTAATAGFNIGTYRSANDRFFEGLIDDVAVWSRVLSESEIAWLAEGNVVPPPLEAETDPIVITLQPEDVSAPVGGTAFLQVAATGTPPLVVRWQRDGVDIPGATGERLVLGDLKSADAGDYMAIIADSQKSATSRVARVEVVELPASPEDSVRIGLNASWSFDVDFSSSSPAHDGTPMGGASISADARIGAGAARFRQAEQQYVDIAAPVIEDDTRTYTVAGWFKVEGGTGRRFLWETAATHYPISTEITPDGTLKAFTRLSDLSSPNLDSFIPAADGEWHHAAVTFNSAAGEAAIYLDGVKVEGEFAPPILNLGTAPTEGFHIGTYRAADGRFFDGWIDDVGVWGRVLTEGEIAWLAAGNGILPPEGRAPAITAISLDAGGIRIEWEGGSGPFKVQYTDALGGEWTDLGPESMENFAVDAPEGAIRFYRVVGQ